MIAALLLPITLLTAGPSHARRVQSDTGDSLIATVDGRRLRMPEVKDLYLDGSTAHGWMGGGTVQRASYGGVVYHVDKGVLVDEQNRPLLSLKPDATECLGCIVAGDSMFWFLQISQDTDYGTSRPVSFAHVYVVNGRPGKLKLAKDIDVKPFVGFASYYVRIRRYHDLVYLGGFMGSYALLNLKTFGVVGLTAGRRDEQPTRDTTDSIISNSGRVYTQVGTELKLLDWSIASWKPIRQISTRGGGGWTTPQTWGTVQYAHDWITAVGLGNDDLLVSNDLVTYARRDVRYAPPVKITDQLSRAQIFLKPGVCVGIVWQYDNERWEDHTKNEYGVLLSLPSMKPLCAIDLGGKAK